MSVRVDGIWGVSVVVYCQGRWNVGCHSIVVYCQGRWNMGCHSIVVYCQGRWNGMWGVTL